MPLSPRFYDLLKRYHATAFRAMLPAITCHHTPLFRCRHRHVAAADTSFSPSSADTSSPAIAARSFSLWCADALCAACGGARQCAPAPGEAGAAERATGSALLFAEASVLLVAISRASACYLLIVCFATPFSPRTPLR